MSLKKKCFGASASYSSNSLHLFALVELRWGPRGAGPPERPGGPRETSVLRGFNGPVKGPLKL